MSTPGSFASKSQLSFGFAIATLCGGLIFYIISSFFRPTPSYNAFAAEPIFLLAGPLVLWRFLAGDRLVSIHRSLGLGLMVALLVVGAVSTMLSENPFEAWNRLKLYYACALLGVSLYLACRANVRAVVVPFLLVIALIHAWFLVEMMTSIYVWGGEGRLAPHMHYFANIRHFGYLGFLAACAGTSVSLLGKRRIFRWLGSVLALLAVYGLIQFGSRGAFLAWLIFAVLLFTLVPARLNFALSFLTTIAVASIIVLLVDTNHPFPNLLQKSIFTRQAGDEDQWKSTGDRVVIWQGSLREIGKRPLLGHGPDAYVLSGCCLKGLVQPHNSVIQFLFEFGILGTSVGLVALGVFLRRPLKLLYSQLARGQPDITLGVLLFLPLSLLAFSMMDGLLYHVVPLQSFSILIGLLGAVASPPAEVGTAA